MTVVGEGLAPVRVAVVNDYELVVRGLMAMLEPHRDRVEVLEADSSITVRADVDIALYDSFSMGGADGSILDRIIDNARVEKVVLYTWDLDSQLVEDALGKGICGVVSKSVGVSGLLEALEKVHRGEVVVLGGAQDEEIATDIAPPDLGGDWPGRAEGLTARESEVIVLITSGLSNDEIASRAYLSINSVKSYIRSAYRKMGVTSRSQAVLWGIDHGFRVRKARLLPPA